MTITLRQAIAKAARVRKQQMARVNAELAHEDVSAGFHHLEICAHLDSLGDDGDEWANSITGERYGN
jgi:hypothetical protein